MPEPQQCGIRAESETYTTAHGNAGSLTRWARPGIKPETSSFLVGFVNHWATTGTPPSLIFKMYKLNVLLPSTTSYFLPWPRFFSFPDGWQCPSFFLFVCLLFRAALKACGGSQARGLIRAVTTGPHHNHSNVRSKPSLQSTPQLTATPDP